MNQDLFTLNGRVALVTGASKGIGLAIARGLAEAGAQVMISSRKKEAIESAAAQLVSEGGAVSGTPCHMGDEEQINAAIEATIEQFGRLDIVVNNAATNPYYGPLQGADADVFDKIMNVNVKGPYLLCKAAYPFLKKHGVGSIINISSVEGIRPDANLGLYGVSKTALITLTQVMAKEYGKDGIRANVIAPGLVKTKFSQALWENEKLMKHVEHNLPSGRIAMPVEMAGLAVFLASDAASYCTGSVFVADGGYLLA